MSIGNKDPPPYPSLYGGEYIVLEVGILLEVNELRDPPPYPSTREGSIYNKGD